MYTVKGKQGLSTQVYENGKTFTKTYEQLFNEHVYMPKRELMFQCLVKDSSDKTILTIEKEDMVSMNIEFDAVNGSKYQFGCLSCAKLNLQVKFSTVITKYSFLEPVIKLKVSYYYTASEKRTEWISVPLGRFIAYDIKSEYLTRTIQAYDTAYAYDEDEITSYPHYNLHTQTNEPHFKFSTSCKLRDIINYINTSTDFAKIRRRQGIDQYNGNYQYTTPIINVEKLGLNSYLDIIVYDLDANMTLRTFIGYLAGLQGKNAVFNRDGELEFRDPLEKARNFEYNGSHYGEYSEEDTQMKVSALQCTTVIGEDKEYTEKYNEEVQSKDENGNLIYDEDGNPVMETVTKQRNYMQFEVSDVTYVEGVTETTAPNDIYVFSNPLMNKDRLAQVLPKVKQTYLPCKFVMKGDPRLDINSTMVLKRRKKTLATDTSYVEEAITIPIMKMKMRLNNSCFLEIEAVADLEEKRSTTLAGSMTQRVGTLGKELTETTSMAKGMFMELYGSQASIGELFSEKAQLGTVVANKITAAEAEFQEVIAKDIEAGKGVIGTVISDMISATDASIKNLIADEIKGVNATIENIDAKNIDVDVLFSDSIITDKATIKDARIGNISADKISAGKLNLSDGIEIGSGDSDDKTKETLVITNNNITMNSPKVIDDEGHTNGFTKRLVIGKQSDDYVIEIYDERGNPLWGAEGLTSGAVNNVGDSTVSGEIIKSLHATKVLIDPNFTSDKTDPTEDGHISLYNYMMDLNGGNVKVTDKDGDEVTLQTCLDELEERNTIVIGGNTQKFNALEKRIENIEDVSIKNLQDKDKNLENQIGTINTNIGNLQNKDTNLQNQINSLKKYDDDLDTLNLPSRMTNAETNISNLIDFRTNLENENLVNRMNTAEDEIDSLQEFKTSAEGRLTTNETEINNLKNIFGDSNIGYDISNLKTRMSAIDDPNTGRMKAVEDNKVDKSTLISQINSTLESDENTGYKLIDSSKILLSIGTLFNTANDGSYELDTLGNYLNSRDQGIEERLSSIEGDLNDTVSENGEIVEGLKTRIITLEGIVQDLLRRIEILESYHGNNGSEEHNE